MAVVATRTLRDAILARLALVANVKIYDGLIRQDDPPPMIAGTSIVKPYVVLYAGGGRAYTEALCGGSDTLSWSPQVTVAAGHPADCFAAVDRVRAELTDKPLVIPDGVTGYLREVVDPGNARTDEQVTPPRYYVPMFYQLIAVASS